MRQSSQWGFRRSFTGAIESQTSNPKFRLLGGGIWCDHRLSHSEDLGKDDWALFVGQWPAAFLLMGVYNKMVKQHGSDAYSKAA
jgi:hypothetical protein